MFFGQVSRTTISFTWIIIGTMSLLISITSLVYLIFKRLRCFFWTPFSTSGILSYFELLLGLTGSWILSVPVIKVSEVFFLLLFRGIRCWYQVTLNTLSPCPDKTEIPKSSLLISISDGFSILVLFQINWLMKYTLIYLLS